MTKTFQQKAEEFIKDNPYGSRFDEWSKMSIKQFAKFLDQEQTQEKKIEKLNDRYSMSPGTSPDVADKINELIDHINSN